MAKVYKTPNQAHSGCVKILIKKLTRQKTRWKRWRQKIRCFSRLEKLSWALYPKVTVTTVKPGERGGLEGGAHSALTTVPCTQSGDEPRPCWAARPRQQRPTPASEDRPRHWALWVHATHSTGNGGFREGQRTLRSFPGLVQIQCVITGAEHEPKASSTICVSRWGRRGREGHLTRRKQSPQTWRRTTEGTGLLVRATPNGLLG